MATPSLPSSTRKIKSQDVDLFDQADRLLDPNFRTPEQAQYERVQRETIVLKTTPTPEPTPRPVTPAMTPSVVAKLHEVLDSPVATKILDDHLSKSSNKEMYRGLLIQLVTVVAPEMKGWVFNIDQLWLGEKLGKSGMSAGRNMWALDRAGLRHYLHTGKVDEHRAKAGRPVMRVDLQPLIVALWESCVSVINSYNQDKEFITLGNDPSTNVHAVYSGTGKHADASMRTPYKYAVARSGHPTVLARSLTASALTTLDYLARAGEATRAELIEATGMSTGAAAGGTRCLAQLGIVTVEWEGPGMPKIYVIRPDWETYLQKMIPHMTGYGARIRLVIRNYDLRIKYIDWMLKSVVSPVVKDELNEHRERLVMGRKKWAADGNKVGAYRRQVEMTPPWGMQ